MFSPSIPGAPRRYAGLVGGWSGCDSHSGPGFVSTCTVTLNARRSVMADFLSLPLPLGVRLR